MIIFLRFLLGEAWSFYINCTVKRNKTSQSDIITTRRSGVLTIVERLLLSRASHTIKNLKRYNKNGIFIDLKRLVLLRRLIT